MERKTDKRQICKKAKCRNAFRDKSGFGRFLNPSGTSSSAEFLQEVPGNIDPARPLKPSRAWFIVAGEIGASAFHCATVPDGPGCKWEGGSFERIEAENRRALKAHFAEIGANALVQQQHMPVNIQGGYRPTYRPLKNGREVSLDEIRARVASGIPFDVPDAGHSCMPDPVIPGVGYDRRAANAATALNAPSIPDDLSVPDCLRR
jgi:hypothetical protein